MSYQQFDLRPAAAAAARRRAPTATTFSGGVRGAARSDARVPRLDHGRGRQRADVRRRRRRLRGAPRPATPGFCRFRSLLATGAILFDRGDFKRKAGSARRQDALAARAPSADARFEALGAGQARLPVRRAFPEGGYYVLGCDFETGRRDPRGGRRRAARLPRDRRPRPRRRAVVHAVRWAASSSWSIRAPTPTTPQPQWRAYFRGTSRAQHRAHRRAGPVGARRQLHVAAQGHAPAAALVQHAERDCFEGWHDGYLRLDDPVMHRRRIVLDKARAHAY